MASRAGISIKLSEATLRQLRREAKATGRSVDAIVRERIASRPRRAQTVYDLIADLIGSVNGPRISATNDQIKFRRRD